MMNLFSSFNPMTSPSMEINWLIITIPMFIVNYIYWTSNSLTLMMMKKMMLNIVYQFKPSMNKIETPNLLMMTMMMMMIMAYNIMSLLPNTFPPTSQIVVNLSMALIMWTSIMLIKLTKMIKLMSHLTPSNTPMPLIPFMVMIELVSLIIQPMTLSIRLTANVTAGHIMMILISNLYSTTTIMAMTLNLIMMIMELGVAMIQAYVFSMLLIMYNK